MRHLEDKALCSRCGTRVHRVSYLMARRAAENVLSWTQVAWIVALILAVVVLGQ